MNFVEVELLKIFQVNFNYCYGQLRSPLQRMKRSRTYAYIKNYILHYANSFPSLIPFDWSYTNSLQSTRCPFSYTSLLKPYPWRKATLVKRYLWKKIPHKREQPTRDEWRKQESFEKRHLSLSSRRLPQRKHFSGVSQKIRRR